MTHHLEPKAGVNHEEDEVGNFSNVDHGVEIVIAFNKCKAFGLA